MSDTFSSLSVHVVFATKDRLPLLRKETRGQVFSYIGGIAKGVGATVMAVGGMADHVHIVARLRTNLCVADFVRSIKANSSKWINQTSSAMKFGWQRGYGAFSVSQSALPEVVRYVRHQERHHRNRSFKDEIELLLKRHEIDFDEADLG